MPFHGGERLSAWVGDVLVVHMLTQDAVNIGGSNAYSGVSTSRTLMLNELRLLFASTHDDTSQPELKAAIVDENVLLKPSAGTRAKTYSYLRDRFGLDPDVPVYRVLRFLWDRDEAGQPLLALLVACLRDPILRVSVPCILEVQPDTVVTSPAFGRAIEAAFPGRLREKTLKSTGENTNSTFKQSGHLSKRNPSTRQRVAATPGSTTLAMLLASLNGAGGQALLDSDWVRLLDSPGEMVLAEARIAASRGWLEYRHAGDVLEISFNKLMTAIGREM